MTLPDPLQQQLTEHNQQQQSLLTPYQGGWLSLIEYRQSLQALTLKLYKTYENYCTIECIGCHFLQLQTGYPRISLALQVTDQGSRLSDDTGKLIVDCTSIKVTPSAAVH